MLARTTPKRLQDPFPQPPYRTAGAQSEHDARVLDARFRRLLAPEAWQRLPDAVKVRFSTPLAAGSAKVYAGAVVETRMSRCGWMLAQAARVVGAPLPVAAEATGPATVVVTEAPELGGQIWTRLYPRPGRFPQAIHSAKRFGGPTGLEEYLGFGLLMALTLSEQNGALVFRSDHFAVEARIGRFRLPAWLAPGVCEIEHRDLGRGRFRFTLTLSHPLLGPLIRQVAEFTDPPAESCSTGIATGGGGMRPPR